MKMMITANLKVQVPTVRLFSLPKMMVLPRWASGLIQKEAWQWCVVFDWLLIDSDSFVHSSLTEKTLKSRLLIPRRSKNYVNDFNKSLHEITPKLLKLWNWKHDSMASYFNLNRTWFIQWLLIFTSVFWKRWMKEFF